MTDATARETYQDDLRRLQQETDRLLATASGLDEAGVREPSLCDGWTRAHVLSHVTRNARAMLNLVATVQGTPTPMYPSREERDADIERGAAKPRDELLAELAESATALTQALGSLDDDARAAGAQVGAGPAPRTLSGQELPRHRLREVVWHHVDLDAGYGFADAPAEDLARWWGEVVEGLREDPDAPAMTLRTNERDVVSIGDGRPTVSGSRAGLLLWLVRGRADHVDAPTPDQLPHLPDEKDTK